MSDGDYPDLSLPAKAPLMARYHHEPMTLHPTHLYTLVDLPDAELEDLARECEGACVELGSDRGDSVRLAPQPRFVGQPLRAVFDCHLERLAQLGKRDALLDFEPGYFIVAVDREWRSKGVVLVTVDDDALECNVDSFRIRAFDVGLVVGGLQVYNSLWEEQKDSYEFHPEDGDEDDGGGDDGGDGDIDDGPGPPAPTKNIPLGYYIPIYIHSSLSEDKVVADLEPAFRYKKPDEYACRVQAKLTPASSAPTSTPTPASGTTSSAQAQGLIQQAAVLHPTRCAKNRYLHKTHILIIDTADPVENGMLMLELPPWDTNRHRPEDTAQVGKELALLAANISTTPSPTPSSAFQPIRIPYHCHDGLQTRFLLLANGDAAWPSPAVRAQSVFLVFQYGGRSGARAMMDPGAAKAGRKPGEERLLYVPELVEHPEMGHERVRWSYDEAVRRFPWCCRERRFVEGLDRRFFVCVDGDGDGDGKGPLLVRRDWDGRVWGRGREELLGLSVDGDGGGVKAVRVPAEEVLDTLEKGRKGEMDGMSESLRDFFL